MLDPEHGKSARIDKFGVVSVVGFVFVEDVPQGVPMRCALHTKSQCVVGVADLVPVLLSGNGVGAGRQHLVDRIETPPEQAGLWPGAIKRNSQCKDLAGPDQASRIDDIFRGNMVARTNLVFLAPASPILEFLCSLCNRLLTNLDVHELLPSHLLLFAASK